MVVLLLLLRLLKRVAVVVLVGEQGNRMVSRLLMLDLRQSCVQMPKQGT